jgi:hypothetical protein
VQNANNINNLNLINVENSINFNGFGNENVHYPYHEYLSQTKESWAFVNNVYSLQKTLFFSHLPASSFLWSFHQNFRMKPQMSTQCTLQ